MLIGFQLIVVWHMSVRSLARGHVIRVCSKCLYNYFPMELDQNFHIYLFLVCTFIFSVIDFSRLKHILAKLPLI